MSRAAVRSRQDEKRRARDLARVDEEYRRFEAYEALDACLVTCDGCGLVQVAPGPPCVLCGSETGSYAGEPPCLGSLTIEPF